MTYTFLREELTNMDLNKSQLDYLLDVLNFHYSENQDIKKDIIDINASICNLILAEKEKIVKREKRIDKKRELLPKPEWN